jgi:hypothetical protein
VIIVDGASFRGRIDMGEVDIEGEREPRARAISAPSRPALRPVAKPAPRPEAKKAEEKTVPAAPKPPGPPAPVAMGAVKRKVIVKRK